MGKSFFAPTVKQADVIVENFRSDVKYRLSVYETVKKIKPDIIYERLRFWSRWALRNETWSRPDYPGHEWTNVYHWRARARPMRVGVAISDTSAGMFLGQGNSPCFAAS